MPFLPVRDNYRRDAASGQCSPKSLNNFRWHQWFSPKCLNNAFSAGIYIYRGMQNYALRDPFPLVDFAALSTPAFIERPFYVSHGASGRRWVRGFFTAI
jgi:hypothetical protein